MTKSAAPSRWSQRIRVLAGLVLSAAPSLSLVRAVEVCPTGKVISYQVPAGETRTGDAYLLARSVSIDGTHDGDVLVWTQSMHVTGTVTGDIFAGGEVLTLDGTAGDSVRFCGKTATVNGTVEGDLIVFAGTLVIGPKGRIAGNLTSFVQQLTMNGEVDGDLKAAGGEVTIGGRIGKNAKLVCEAANLTPNARIEGDLVYESRRELSPSPAGQVGGKVQYEPKADKKKNSEGGFSSKSVLWWLFWTIAALLVGLVGLALFRRSGPEITATVGRDALGSLGVGFIAVIVVPVAAIVVCLLIVTVPMAVLALFLYVVAVYVAKIPVGVWLGQRVLRWAGRTSPSPFAGLLVGVPLLYLLFKVPYLGKLSWFACLCVGMGAILLGTRSFLRVRSAGGTDPLPGPAPASSAPLQV